MKDVVSISQLTVEMQIGAYEWEKSLRQKVLVDVDLTCDTRQAGLSDDLSDAIDYAEIAKAIEQLAKGKHYQLIESFAETISQQILATNPIANVRVKVVKPGAIPSARSVSVTIERSAAS